MTKPNWSFRTHKNAFQWKPIYRSNPLLLKHKDGVPRIELVPTKRLIWLWWEFVLRQGSDAEWEFYIWCTQYCDGDIQKTVDTWPWGRFINGKWKRNNPLK